MNHLHAVRHRRPPALITCSAAIICFDLSMIQTLFGSLEEEKKPGLFDRMKEAVTRTRENLSERIEEVVSFGKEIDRGNARRSGSAL